LHEFIDCETFPTTINAVSLHMLKHLVFRLDSFSLRVVVVFKL